MSTTLFLIMNWLLSFAFQDHKGQVSYIATQHPLRETVEDFWRMVWDQKALTVVMVNNEEKENPVRQVQIVWKGMCH